MDKKELRKEILSSRAKLTKDENISISRTIVDKLLETDHYKNAKTIMCYISFGSEINTHEFIKKAIDDGKNLVVPVTFKENRLMKPSQLLSFDELEVGYFNILTPKEEFIRYIDPKEIDLVIVPGAAFDKNGYRVGFGGGYYDTFLAGLDCKTISIAFDLQIVERVPREDHDLPVNMIITEKETIIVKK